MIALSVDDFNDIDYCQVHMTILISDDDFNDYVYSQSIFKYFA